ncbi:MAG: hypothetical protein KatS3mg015_2753 [Fimbriimonadales bacterium]|nr:MAG: hypothetical protein KatS3mg015_2753 [Fimbriimonadales bacterium]
MKLDAYYTSSWGFIALRPGAEAVYRLRLRGDDFVATAYAPQCDPQGRPFALREITCHRHDEWLLAHDPRVAPGQPIILLIHERGYRTPRIEPFRNVGGQYFVPALWLRPLSLDDVEALELKEVCE